MKSKFLLLISGILLAFLITNVSAVVTYGDWENNQSDIQITFGDSVDFSADFSSMNPPMTINIRLYDSSDNLVHSFENGKVVNGNGFAQTYTITEAIYQDTGNFELRLSASDAFPDSDSYTLTLRVNPAPQPPNTAPIITSTAVMSVDENTHYFYDVDATDSDGDTLTYSMTGPSWLSINSATGLISGTAPSVTADAQDTITIIVSDGQANAVQTYTLNVINVVSPPPANTDPVINSTPITTVDENQTYTYDVDATDSDGDVLTYSFSGPGWLSIDSQTGLITGTAPEVSADTPFDVSIVVNDGNNGTATQTYALTVANVVSPPPANNVPIITSTPVTQVNEGTNYVYQVTATDADNDTLTYSMTGPSWLTVNANTGLISGTAPNVSADTPFDITITVSDGQATATQTYTLTVNNVYPGAGNRGKTGGTGARLITDNFDEEQYANQFAPITATEDTPETQTKRTSALKIFLIIFWLIIFLLLIVLAVILARRIKK